MEINFNITKRSNEHIMKKFKVLSLILALILVFSMFPMSVMASETDTQTESAEQTTDAMAITTVDQFKALNGQSGTYYLASDINFEGASFDTAIVESFNGVLDGRGKTIYGFEINYNPTEAAADAVNLGLFGTLGTNAVISDLNVGKADAKVTVTVGTAAGAVNAGALAGAGVGTTFVTNVNVYGTITVNATGATVVGGVLGNAVAPDLSECKFEGTITASKGIAGGIVGATGDAEDSKANSLIRKCESNATVTVSGDGAVAAGIVGVANSTVQLMECKSASAGILGKSNATATTALTLIYKCTTASETNVYGTEVVTGQRVCIMGCSAQNLPDYDASKDYGDNVYSYIIPITSEADLAKIGNSEHIEYATTGFYRLENNITLSKAYSAYVVEIFSGVFDGAGHTFDKVKVSYGTAGNRNSNVIGFFGEAAIDGDAVFMNLQIGTETSPTSLSMASARNTGALIGGGYTATEYSTIVYNFDAYVTNTSKNPSNKFQRIGGIMGYSYGSKIVDSNVYGTIVDYPSVGTTILGGFVGSCDDGAQVLVLNSNNYADVLASSPSAINKLYLIASGFIAGSADNTYDAVFHNCVNFGNVQHTWKDDIADEDTMFPVRVAGFSGLAGASVTLSNCANFGNIKGKLSGNREAAMVGSAVGEAHSATTAVSLVNFTDYGTVTTDIPSSSRYVHTANENTAVKYCNANSYDAVVSMTQGAAIRIDDVKGIRFKSTVSTDAIAALEDIFGEGTVSYGTIITPSAFIHNENGAGEFTMEALDAFGDRLGTLGGDKAYVKIDSTNQWFNNENGHIAGSIVGIDPLLYQVKFSARAYVSVTVNGTPIYTLYSDYSEENNSRSVEYVANKAIADFKYQKNTDTTKWYNDEACTEEYTKDDKTTYKNVVSEANGVIKYSCYTADQLAAINTILDTIPDTPATAG